jgi:hypothetical protein
VQERKIVRKKQPQKSSSKSSRMANDDALARAFGIWRHMKIDSLEYQRKLRAEWESDGDPSDVVDVGRIPSRGGRQ